MDRILIPAGVLSKTYQLSSGRQASVAYNTRAQAVALFEDDSSAVWQLLFEDRGNSVRALDYIWRNGEFTSGDGNQARRVLDEFEKELLEIGLAFRENAGGERFAPGLAVRPNEDTGRLTERKISNLMAEHHVLYSLVLELTYRCNERCVHCYCPSKRQREELPLESLTQLLDEFYAMGGFALQLTGGELFLRKDIRPLLRRLAGRGFLISIISNLNLLDEELLDCIDDLQPRSVGCSIYAATPSLHDEVTGVVGSFDKSIQSIMLLRGRGIPVAMKTPLMRRTAASWKDVEKLAEDLGCAVQFDVNITARNDGGLAPLELRVRDDEIIRSLFARRFNQLHQYDEPLETAEPAAEALLCGAGAAGLSVGPDGTIHPCIGLPIALGRWPTDSLTKVWTTSGFFKDWTSRKLMDIPKCRECEFLSSCFRCPGAWFVEHGAFDRPNEYTCYLARIAATSGHGAGGTPTLATPHVETRKGGDSSEAEDQ